MSYVYAWRRLLLATTVGVVLASPAYAAIGPGPLDVIQGPAAVRAKDDRALALSLAVRERATNTSMAALELFAEQAALRADERALGELQHAISILLDQSEFEKAAGWNRSLERLAGRLGRHQYVELTRINDLMIRGLRDGAGSVAEADNLLRGQRHWLPRVMAKQAKARILLDAMQPAEAMRVLADAMVELEGYDGREAGVAIALWHSVSLVHAAVDDLPGYMTAVEMGEEERKRSAYPNPDYESLYWLALSLGQVGRYDEARGAAAIYAELADRTGTPMARGNASVACSLVETAADNWSGVLNCFAPFSDGVEMPLQPRLMMLPRRATAYARTGQLAKALRDLQEIRALQDAGTMREVLAVDRAEAEYLLATGDYARGVPLLRKYHVTMYRVAAQRTSAMMEQAVVSMNDRVHQERERTQLKENTISAQRWLMGLGGLLGFTLGLMFFRQRALSRKLASINERQAEAQARQAELFTNVSHEIRTPLNGVVAMADALGKASLPAEAAKMARIMSSSANTLERLMSDILDIAKIDSGQLSIEPAPFCLKQLMDDVAALWAPRALEKGIKVVTQFGADSAVWVMGDRVRLMQVLNNLVSNAMKFTEQGKIVLSVVAHGHDRFLFAVTDTGVGFDMSCKADLFKRFRQADSTITRRFGGTGLGLPISKQLVEMMGGVLDCESDVGEGAQFWFELQLPRVDQQATGLAGAAVPMEGEEVSRYLIVDDNATNRTIVAMLLQDESRQLHFAENGLEAVEMCRTIPFDVVLMDVQMPVMSGIDAIRIIRDEEKRDAKTSAAIVILSANADSHHQKEGLDVGADGFIAKPIVLDRLVQGIEQAVAKRASLNARGVSVGG